MTITHIAKRRSRKSQACGLFPIALVFVAAALVPVAAIAVDPKGLYLSEAREGLKFNVLLERDGLEKTVSTDYGFRDGDRLKFRFEINQDAYVYVVHRQIPGDPSSEAVSRHAGLKGIRMVLNPGQPAAARPSGSGAGPAETAAAGPLAYTLLFPSEGAGSANKLEAGKMHDVPLRHGRVFAMDDQPGIEKLYVILAPSKLQRLEQFFGENGKHHESGGSGRQLTAMLAEYSGNAGVSIGKGISVETRESYGVAVESGKPFMTEVDLAHR